MAIKKKHTLGHFYMIEISTTPFSQFKSNHLIPIEEVVVPGSSFFMNLDVSKLSIQV